MSQQRNNAIRVVKAPGRAKVLAELEAQDFEEPLIEGHEDAEAPGGDMPFARISAPTLINTNGSDRKFSRVSGVGGGDRTFSRTSVLSVAPRWFVRDYLAIKEIIFSSPINLLLICIPLGFVSKFVGWGPVATFTLNFLSLVPLALILGDVTEDLALRFGDVTGGLINATFGNVVEVMVSLFALFKNLFTVVAASLLGSILSNLLLVLGCSFFAGGMFHSIQTFNALSNRACSSLLMLACIGITIPSASSMLLVSNPDMRADWILDVSRGTAIIMLICYVCYLTFQLKTHTELFKGDDDDTEPMMTMGTSFGMLTIITIIVAFCSEFLTGSIEEVSKHTGISETFLGLIVLPIAGNACEHMTAVVVATKNKMDLSMGVAVGSSIQIALFAVPFAVVVGWVSGHDFSLDFTPFSALVLAVCVIHANFVTADATSHWLLGVQLIALYCLIALAFFYS